MLQLGSVDLNLLPVFEAVYREGNLTRAGEKLGLTQSAVSHALARLRKVAGDPLFVRTKKGMEPTPRARELYVPLAGSLSGIREALAAPAAFDPATVSRTFLLSMSDYCGMVILPALMRELGQRAPGVRIEISPLASDRTQEGLESGAFELVAGNRDVGSGVYRKRIFQDDFVCMVRKEHPAIGASLDLSTYLSLSHALFSPRERGDRLVGKTLGGMGLRRKVALRVPHILVIPKVVETTDLLVTLPRRLAASFESQERFRLLPPPVAIPPLTLMLYWHERVNNDPANRWLRSTIAGLDLTV